MDWLKELPIARLHMPNGTVIEGYNGQYALGRFNGKLFVMKHVFSKEHRCFVPEVFADRAAADRAALVNFREDGISYTALPVDSAFGYISQAALELA